MEILQADLENVRRKENFSIKAMWLLEDEGGED